MDEHPFALDRSTGVRGVHLDLRSVPALDATGLVGLESAFERLHRHGILKVLGGAQPQPLRAMARAGWSDREGRLAIDRGSDRAVDEVRRAFGSRTGDVACAGGSC